MKFAAIASFLLLCGCEVSSPITPAGRDTYMISSHVAMCGNCSAAVQSLKTANTFCAKEGKFAVIQMTNGATNGFGYNVSNEMLFRCVTADDPAYQHPTLRPDNGVSTIENR